jgi:hypothetical protein
MKAALRLGDSLPQVEEDHLLRVVEHLKLSQRRISQRVSWEEMASGAARMA